MANVLKKDIAGDYALRLAWRYQEIDFLGLPNLNDNPSSRLDDIYVPLRVTWDSRRDPEKKPLYIPEALEQCAAEKVRHLVVLGDPGSGKSTLVKVIVSAFGRSAGSSFKRLFGELLPVPIMLRDYRDKVRRWQSKEAMLSDFIATLDAEIRDEISVDWLLGELREGRGFLLLDGLDEVGDGETRKQLRDKVVRPLLKEIPESYAILTSRIVGYEEVPFEAYVSLEKYSEDDPNRWFPLPIRRCYVAPFTDEDIEQFIVRWYRARESSSDRQQAGIQSFKGALHQNDRVRRLAGNPLLLTLMALVHRVTANLPSGRVKLYDKIVEAFLETIQVYRQLGTPATLDEMKRWLAKVGWQMQERRGSQSENDEALLVHRDEVLAWVTEAISQERGAREAPEDAEKFLDYVMRRSGLLVEAKPQHFAFVHLTFQEYFAAFELRSRVRRFDKLAETCAELVARRYWHETLNLLFEMLSEFSGAGNDLVDEIKSRTSSSLEAEQAAAELFSALLIDEENGLSIKKQQEACEFVLKLVCDDYDNVIIGNLQKIPAAVQTMASEWFAKQLETATNGNTFGKDFFFVGADLFTDWPERLSHWVDVKDNRELSELQVAEITLIAARDSEAYAKVGPWAIERLPFAFWLKRIHSLFITDHMSLADIYRQSIYASFSDSPKHRLLTELTIGAAICGSQFFRLICSTIEYKPANSLAISIKSGRNTVRFNNAYLSLPVDEAHHLAPTLDRVLARDLFRHQARTREPRVINSIDQNLIDALVQALALTPSQRPNIPGDKVGTTQTFAEAEWVFFAPAAFEVEGEKLIHRLEVLEQAEDDWTRLLALAARLSLGEGSPAMCNERNALLEKGMNESASFTFPSELHSETEAEAFREQLPELLEIVYLHSPNLIWLLPELFDPASPESKYFLSKPREFFRLAAEALDPEQQTELRAWREEQGKRKDND